MEKNEIAIQFLQKYIKSKDYNPEQISGYFLNIIAICDC